MSLSCGGVHDRLHETPSANWRRTISPTERKVGQPSCIGAVDRREIRQRATSAFGQEPSCSAISSMTAKSSVFRSLRAAGRQCAQAARRFLCCFQRSVGAISHGRRCGSVSDPMLWQAEGQFDGRAGGWPGCCPSTHIRTGTFPGGRSETVRLYCNGNGTYRWWETFFDMS